MPEFYTRAESGIPTAWVARIRESMTQLTPQFSANRAVREYTEEHYLPVAADYRLRIADRGATGRQIVDWRNSLEQKWASLHFGEVKVETLGYKHEFEVQIWLNDLDPEAVRVELYADGVKGRAPVRQEMKRSDGSAGAPGRHVYTAAVSSARSSSDYAARAIPHFEGVFYPTGRSANPLAAMIRQRAPALATPAMQTRSISSAATRP
jgi:glycogen phosphorylase